MVHPIDDVPPISSRVGTERLAWYLSVSRQYLLQLCRFLDPPLRTLHAAFTAHGAPEIDFLSRDYSVVRHSVDFIEIAELHLLLTPIAIVNGSRRFLFFRSVNLPASFPMWPAFPTSEYYDASDTAQVSPSDLLDSVSGQSPTFTSMDSTREFRWRL